MPRTDADVQRARASEPPPIPFGAWAALTGAVLMTLSGIACVACIVMYCLEDERFLSPWFARVMLSAMLTVALSGATQIACIVWRGQQRAAHPTEPPEGGESG